MELFSWIAVCSPLHSPAAPQHSFIRCNLALVQNALGFSCYALVVPQYPVNFMWVEIVDVSMRYLSSSSSSSSASSLSSSSWAFDWMLLQLPVLLSFQVSKQCRIYNAIADNTCIEFVRSGNASLFQKTSQMRVAFLSALLFFFAIRSWFFVLFANRPLLFFWYLASSKWNILYVYMSIILYTVDVLSVCKIK